MNVLFRTLKNLAKYGLSLAELRMRQLRTKHIDLLWSRENEEAHEYGPEFNKQEYKKLMKSGLSTLIMVTGHESVYRVHAMLGDKEPSKAEKGTLRSYYGTSRLNNMFYSSHDEVEAVQELATFFHKEKILYF